MSGRQIGSAVGFVIGAMAGGNWQIGMAIGPAVGTVGDPEIMEEDDEPFPSLD